jgi:hypothetical protein
MISFLSKKIETLTVYEPENKLIMNKLQKINLDTIENSCPTFINENLSPEEKGDYMEYPDIFAFFSS